MAESVTIARKTGQDIKPHQVSSGQVTVAFEGDGPWQVSADDWRAIEWLASEAFELAQATTKTKQKPALVAEKE